VRSAYGARWRWRRPPCRRRRSLPTLQLEYSWTPYAESVGGIDSVLNCFLGYAERHWPGRIEVKSLGGAEGESPAGHCAARTAIRPICGRSVRWFR